MWVYGCVVPPYEGSPFPTGCDYVYIRSEVLNPEQVANTKEQWDALFGAVITVVVAIVIIGLLKKAIEQ